MYYVICDRPITAGDTLPGHGDDIDEAPVVAAEDPRAVNMVPLLDSGRLPGLSTLIRDARISLASVEPTGPVLDFASDHRSVSAEEWTVREVLPLATLWGPQGQHLVEFAAEAEHRLGTDHEGTVTYSAWVETQRSADPVERSEYRNALSAAGRALDTAGADRDWWREKALPDARGAEILALAVRDLVGVVPTWTPEAYAALTEPWRRAFGPVHPGDELPCRQPGEQPHPAAASDPCADVVPALDARFYTVVSHTTELGAHLEDHRVPTAPEHIELEERLSSLGHGESLLDLAGQYRLAVVEPRGLPQAQMYPDQFPLGRQQWSCLPGWRVIELHSPASILGEHGEAVLQLARTAEAVLNEDGARYDPQREERYLDAMEEQDIDAVEDAAAAAESALSTAGRDGSWLRIVAGSCVQCLAHLALAARPLLEENSAWNSEAYAVLTEVWRTALGPVHPDDQLPAAPSPHLSEAPSPA